MNEYYGELFDHGDPVIAAGWRHQLEQALRYEIALESIDLSAFCAARPLKVLDVGCGPGNLWKYLQSIGFESAQDVENLEYTGIDRLQAAVELARLRFPEASFIHRNLYEFGKEQCSPSFDAVFAIGTMVSGVDIADDSARVRRLEQLVEHSFALSQGAFCLVVLNQAVVEERVSLRSESALLGAFSDELHALGKRIADEFSAHYAVREDFLTTDIALYLWREGTAAPGFIGQSSRLLAHERVLAGPWGREHSALEHAWLWMESGAYKRADVILNADPMPEGEHADLMRLRLDFVRS